MTYDEIKTAWNAQADEHNQWDDLGEDEKIEWAASSAAAKERAAHQAAQEGWTPAVNDSLTALAQRKLDDLLTQGFRITGYAIERTDVADWAPQRGFVTHGGLVGWWTPHQIDRIPGAQHGQPT